MSESIKVSMIVIGDEILNGRTIDSNGSFLSKYLFKKGLELSSIKFIRDLEQDMIRALSEAMEESDVVITSGGIGPTLDDKTKKTFADFFGKKLIERDEVAAIVAENYHRFGRSWHREMNHYHIFPQDFIALKNPKGLAPGLAYFDPEKKKLLLSGPGVPREFFEMVDSEFLPYIARTFADGFRPNFQTVIRTHGVPEEKIFFELCPQLWEQLERFGKVSSLPHTIGVDIVVSYHGDEKDHQKKQKDITELINNGPLKDHVWQFGNSPLNERVLERALTKKKTFAFAESCTGGLCASKITDLPGASSAFWGSVVCYDNSVKKNVLKVKEETLKSFGAVSMQTAEEMASGVRSLLNVDYAVAITGIAGPEGGTTEKPVGTVAIAFAGANKNGSALFQFPGDRLRLKDRFSDRALLTLLELIESE